MRARIVAKNCATGEVRLALRCGGANDANVKVAGLLDDPYAKPKVEPPVSLVYGSFVQDSDFDISIGSRRGYGFGTNATPRIFTRYAAHTISEACAIIEGKHGKQCVFVTATVPANTAEAIRAFAAWSGYALLLLNQRIRDVLHGSDVLSVWELQERGALHLHMAVAHKDRDRLEKWGVYFCRLWHSILRTISEKSGINMLASADGEVSDRHYPMLRTDSQWVKKSLRHYLAKYLSKEACNGTNDSVFPPARWWSVSKGVLAAVHAARNIVSGVQESMGAARAFFDRIAGEVVAHCQQVYWYESEMEPGSIFLVLIQGTDGGGAVWDYLKSALEFTHRPWGYRGAGRVLSNL